MTDMWRPFIVKYLLEGSMSGHFSPLSAQGLFCVYSALGLASVVFLAWLATCGLRRDFCRTHGAAQSPD